MTRARNPCLRKFPTDELARSRAAGESAAEVGVRHILEYAAALRDPPGTLPDNEEELAGLAGVAVEELAPMLPRISSDWRRRKGLYVLPDVVGDVRWSVKVSRQASQAARARWNRTREPKTEGAKKVGAMPPHMQPNMQAQCLSSSSSSSSPSSSSSLLSGEEDTDPAIVPEIVDGYADPSEGFPLQSGEIWMLDQAAYCELRRSYPALGDRALRETLLAARGWLIENPDKRKTARGMRRFLGGWIRRELAEQRKGGNGGDLEDTPTRAAIRRLVREEGGHLV